MVIAYLQMTMTLKRMENVLIVVDDLETVKPFFIELGLSIIVALAEQLG